jgi:hypothetical protein
MLCASALHVPPWSAQAPACALPPQPRSRCGETPPSTKLAGPPLRRPWPKLRPPAGGLRVGTPCSALECASASLRLVPQPRSRCGKHRPRRSSPGLRFAAHGRSFARPQAGCASALHVLPWSAPVPLAGTSALAGQPSSRTSSKLQTRVMGRPSASAMILRSASSDMSRWLPLKFRSWNPACFRRSPSRFSRPM